MQPANTRTILLAGGVVHMRLGGGGGAGWRTRATLDGLTC
jgi:hypothetical protein